MLFGCFCSACPAKRTSGNNVDDSGEISALSIEGEESILPNFFAVYFDHEDMLSFCSLPVDYAVVRCLLFNITFLKPEWEMKVTLSL